MHGEGGIGSCLAQPKLKLKSKLGRDCPKFSVLIDGWIVVS